MKRLGLVIGVSGSMFAAPCASQQIETGDLIFFAQDTASGDYGAYLLSDLNSLFGIEPTPFRLPGDMFEVGDFFSPANVGFGGNIWMDRVGQGVEGILPIVDQDLNLVPFAIKGEDAASSLLEPISLPAIGDLLFPGDMGIPGGDQFDLVFFPGDMGIPGGDQFQPSRPLTVFTNADSNMVTIVELNDLGAGDGGAEVWAEFEVRDVSLLLGGIVAPDMLAADLTDSPFFQMAFYEDGIEGGPPTLHLVDAGTGDVTSLPLPEQMAGIQTFSASENGLHGLRFNELKETVEVVNYYPQTDVFLVPLDPATTFDGSDFNVLQLLAANSAAGYPPQQGRSSERGLPEDVLVFAVPAGQDRAGSIVAVNTGTGEIGLVAAGGEGFRDPRDIAYVITDPVEPPPDPCLPDTNGDGRVTPADFNAWILAFNTNAPECDQNNDGLCTPADFNAWILNYNAGC